MQNIETSTDLPDRRWWALGVLCLSLLVVGIDTSILNVALPTLIEDLDASPSQLQWIIDSYVLVFAGLLLTAGKLGDRYGRKGVMQVGLVVFLIGSVGASAASTSAALIGWRAFMGIGAALVMPATLSILVNIFTEARQRRRAIAYWSLMNASAAFVGPVTGGLLLRHFWWGSCFLVNVPFLLAALVAGHFLVPSSKDPEAAKRFDVLGAVLSSLALGALLWGVIEGPVKGWSHPAVVGGFVVAVASLVGFVAWELRRPDPMLDLTTFKSDQLRASVLAMTIATIAMTGTMFLIQQSLQLVKGYSPLASALATSGPIVTVNFLLMPRAPRLTERYGIRWLVAGGGALIAVASLTIALTTVESSYANLLVGFALMAAAFSIFVPASTEAVMTSVPPEQSGGASAINQMTRQVGAALGVALAGSIAASGYRSGFHAPDVALPDGAADQGGASITDALAAARDLTGEARDAFLRAAHEAFLHGVRYAVVASAVLAAIGAVYAAKAIPSHVARAHDPDAAADDADADADDEVPDLTR